MKKCSRIVSGIFLLAWIFLASTSFAEVVLMPKQLIVLKPGIDQILGTWVAAVNNRGQVPERFSLPVLLPREAKDFQPIEGIAAADLKLGDLGLVVQKEFPPGVSVLSVGFMLPASFGQATLHLKAMVDVGELTVMSPRGLLDIDSQDLSEAGSDVQDMQRYSVWTSNRMVIAAQDVLVGVSGVPEGRARLWAIGGILAGILAVGAGLLTRRASQRAMATDKYELG